MFSPPQKDLPPRFTGCGVTHRQGTLGCSAGPSAVARWAAFHPWRPGDFCQAAPRALPKTQGASRMLFRTPSTQIPHIELIFFWTYIQLFFLGVIKPWGNKENTEEGRKTLVESARRKGRAGGTCKWLPLAGKEKRNHVCTKRHNFLPNTNAGNRKRATSGPPSPFSEEKAVHWEHSVFPFILVTSFLFTQPNKK